jgi:hypothetical protein
MARVALALSTAVSALGAIGVLSPNTLLAIGREFASPVGLLVAAAIRVVFGGVLMLTAPASRAPRTLRLIGLVILVVGVITPFFGVERTRAILDWWSGQGALLTRIPPAVALALGCSLFYLLSPRRSTA